MKRRHHMLEWDGAPMEQLGPQWARLGIEPSISCNLPFSIGDTVQQIGSNQRMVISRNVEMEERMERCRLLGSIIRPDLPYCYIVLAD